jgi:hypothetical protein
MITSSNLEFNFNGGQRKFAIRIVKENKTVEYGWSKIGEYKMQPIFGITIKSLFVCDLLESHLLLYVLKLDYLILTF